MLLVLLMSSVVYSILGHMVDASDFRCSTHMDIHPLYALKHVAYLALCEMFLAYLFLAEQNTLFYKRS